MCAKRPNSISGNATLRDQVALRRLIDTVVNETADRAEFERLQRTLEDHKWARMFYIEYVHVDAALRRHFLVDQESGLTELSLPLTPGPRPGPGQRWQRMMKSSTPWVLACVILLFIGLVLSQQFGQPRTVPDQAPGRATVQTAPQGGPRHVAVLTDAIDVEWPDTFSEEPAIGDALLPGLVQLDQGLVRIEFYGGAAAILEGPAALELQSPERGYLHFGRLRTFVPERAKGFTIASPGGDVEDLGTEFAIDVSREGTAEVHVIDGEVRLRPNGGVRAAHLVSGNALRLLPDGEQSTIPLQVDLFAGPDQLAERGAVTRERQFRRWQTGIDGLRNNPNLEALYSFQDSVGWGNTLADVALAANGTTEGAVVGCDWTEGRWAQKKALRFSDTSDRVRINIPGTHEAITLLTWVKVDRMSNERIAIMHPEETGAHYVHWTLVPVNDMAVIHFAVTDGTDKLRPDRRHYNSRFHAVLPEETGQWLHFAVTYDPANGVVSHYKNGRVLGTATIETPQLVRVGVGDLGNWPYKEWAKGTEFAVRNFEGIMDEFMVFSRALQAEEVCEIYEFGVPHTSN